MNELALAARRASQLLERAQDVEVLRIDRERLGEGVLGAPLVVELVAPPSGEAHVEIHARRGRQVLRGLQRAGERLGGLSQPLLTVARRSSSASDVVVRRLLGDRRFDGALRARAIADHLLEDAREIEPRADPIAATTWARATRRS